MFCFVAICDGGGLAGKDISVKKYVVRLSAGNASICKRCPQRKEPGEAAVEGAHSVEGRCLGGRRRLERQPDHPGLGHQCVHDLPGTQATAGRGLRSGVEPQTAHDTAHCCDFRRREGSQADRPGVLQAAEGARPLDVRLLESKVVELGIVERASDSTIGRTLKKTVSSRIAGNARSSRRRPTAPS